MTTETAQLEGSLAVVEAVAFVAALVCRGLMIYAFWLAVTTVAFWIIRIDEIAELFEGVCQSGRWPVTIYPAWLRLEAEPKERPACRERDDREPGRYSGASS